LPGFRFEAQTRATPDVLPRMDVAAFVGFTASGPINRPVVIESVESFADIFGEEAPLAWNDARGERVRAHLAPAVRAFFRNGGRRCWIIRVAGREASYNYFPVPGLVRLRRNGTLAPAYARARSRGSWSDSLRTSAALITRPLALARFASPEDFDLELTSSEDVAAGDLLRMTFDAEGYVLMVVVGSANVVEGDSSPPDDFVMRRVVVSIKSRLTRWFKMPAPPSSSGEGDAFIFTSDMKRRRARAFAPDEMWSSDKAVALNLALPTDAAPPPPGTLVRVDFADEQLWLMVQSSNVVEDAATPSQASVQVTGEAFYWLKGKAPSPLPSSDPFVERLQFELSVRRGDTEPVRLDDLGFALGHARFWGALPTDEELFADTGTPFESRSRAERIGRADFKTKYDSLWQSVAAAPRFPFAGRHKLEERDIYFPLAMPALSEAYLRPVKLRRTALERDGLALFDDSLFLDPQLRETDTETLMSQADFIRYGSPQPRALSGIHAALEIEEATIIVVPDEVHAGWQMVKAERIEASQSKPVPHPEWWRSLECDPPLSKLPEALTPPLSHFLDCDLVVVERPTLTSDEPDPAGTFTLNWEAEDESNASYVLEEATSPGWDESFVIYSGPKTSITLYGRSAGDYFYRVRAEVGRSSSEWSSGVVVRVSTPGQWRSKRAKDYSPSTLLNVHRALLRMCAARGDLFALLSLPQHYRETEALAHSSALRMQIRPTLPGERAAAMRQIPPLSYAEERALSYGALYHPWLVGREENSLAELRVTPPTGAVCGLYAARAIERGAWAAPANEPLSGVVALAPQMLRYRLLDLQTAQVNIVRQEPRGFLVLDADTLSDDPDLRSIGVRRLLILLRRLALRLGATYVFEPNDDSFRRLVERGFEEMMEGMFTRGAFAGQTPATSYRVDTGSPPNTPQSVEQGRFIVELRVAPSQPLSFMTIRLLQTNERDMVIEER
jgi:hypothetical protein